MINWEQKIELVKSINNKDFAEIEKFVDTNIENFDCQAWDMFALTTLTCDKYSKGFFDKVKTHYKKAYESGLLNNLSMRSAIRLEMAFGDEREVKDDQ